MSRPVVRIPIQSRELEVALASEPDGVLQRAARVVAIVMSGRVVVIEELIGEVGGEEVIEETILEAGVPS